AITDASGNLVESLSYDPWGRRRKATNWTDYNVTSTLFDRGYTGHEDLPHFGLINMNGRVYDPFLARFLSPDPFVQAPSYTQNYNRYSYAWNNPLKYTDPSGEWVHIAFGAAIGGIANLAMNWGKVGNLGQGLGYFFIGAGAGALSAGIGAGFGTLVAGSGSFGFMSATGLTAAGFLPGAAAGAGAGFTSGFVTGTGNSLMQGEKLKQSLGKGLQSGAWGLAIGGLTGGIQGGIRAHRFGNDFWSGGPTIHKKLDILWEKARLTGVIEPIDQAVGDVRIGRNSELEGALARARYGKTMPITEFREVNGLKYPKVATEQNDILLSRRLVRQMWRGAAPLEAINHEVIHTSDMFSAAYWNSPHFETLISDYSHTALNAWMEVRAYSVNVQRSNWPLFSLNLMRYQNILNLYGIQ
ncbi:MAG TPA: RHS repeat-associated core domain-containing protein, partial [Bacteroidales bacterium]|nr:RHS repeat-associated core domain-containing protein [Bacteroidales bacterium]